MAKRKRDGSNVGEDSRNSNDRKQKNGTTASGIVAVSEGSKDIAVVAQTKEEAKHQLDGVRIIVGSYEKVLCGINAAIDWKVGANKSQVILHPVYMFSAHAGAIKCLASNDRYLVSGGSDEVIKIYDLRKRRDLGSLVQHNAAITALQFYSRKYLLSTSEDATICIWRTRDWECMTTMKGHKGRVNGLSVHPTGKIAISVGKDKTLRLWNLMTGRKASATKLREEGFDVKWNFSGDQYAILFDRKVVIYNMNAEPLVTIEHNMRLHCVRYFQHPTHGETLVAGTDDKLIKFYSAKDGKELQVLKGHGARVKALDSMTISEEPNVQVIASADSDGVVKTWVVAKDGTITESGSYDTGNRLICLALHDAAIEQLELVLTAVNRFAVKSESETSSEIEYLDDDEEWGGIEDS